jgi:hypothetical protein
MGEWRNPLWELQVEADRITREAQESGNPTPCVPDFVVWADVPAPVALHRFLIRWDWPRHNQPDTDLGSE